MSLFELVYDVEAPYPRIIADTGKLAPAAKRGEIVSPVHIEGGALSPCCVLEGNLERQDSGRPDMMMTVCRRCHRRHFKGIAEGGHMGISRA